MPWKPTALVVFIAAFATAAFAAPLATGATMPALTLTDQHDVSRGIDAATRLVIFTGDMDASDHVAETLADDGAEKLDAAGAVWIANISGMPSIITKLFAMPKLRKRPYPMLLDRDGKATADFPSNSGHATLVHLDHFKIESIEYAGSAAEVAAALSASAGTASTSTEP